MMGSPTNEKGRFNNEQQHRVTLTRDYYTNKKVVSGFLKGFTSIITNVKTKFIVKPFLFEYIKKNIQ